MNKLTVLSLAISLISGYAGAQTIVLTDSENGIELGNWRIDSSQLKIPLRVSACNSKSCMVASKRDRKSLP